MFFQTLYRALNILKLEKNTYKEISKDNTSIFESGIVILVAGIVNVYLFKLFIQPTLPNDVPLIPIFLIWIFFNWYVFSNVLLIIVRVVGGKQNLKNKRIAFSLVGYSNAAEIFKILIIFFPNFIIIISWSILMLVIASQVVGVKQIYNLDKISTAVGVIITSYIAQFFIIGFFVLILIKLAY